MTRSLDEPKYIPDERYFFGEPKKRHRKKSHGKKKSRKKVTGNKVTGKKVTIIKDQEKIHTSVHKCTAGPLYNTVHYNTVWDITLIIVGPQLDYFCYMSIDFTLIITRFG